MTNSGGSNKSNLQEGFRESWSALIAHSRNSAPWDIGKHILAEQNRRNEVTTNNKRFSNSALRQFRTTGTVFSGRIHRKAEANQNSRKDRSRQAKCTAYYYYCELRLASAFLFFRQNVNPAAGCKPMRAK